MLPKAEKACFAIADISGYTHFVSGVELDHAQDIIADIMDTLVRALRPPFRLAKFEGDAAFVYALADKVDGSLLQDSIEEGWIPTRSATPSTALVPQRKVGFPIPNAGLLLGFQGTKTARRGGISSPFSDAGGCTSPQNSGGARGSPQ